jgi:tRNA threonylcarbamoyladenosine biosynthesis protein TsaB
VLGIDTSGKTASVALCNENTVLAQTTVLTKLTHSQVIMPLCEAVLKNAGEKLENIDGIAVADGPGSYTGLRIGISVVKAMSFALNKGCTGVSTLEALAYNFKGIKAVVCAVMHARLNLVYAAFFESDGEKIIRLTTDRIISDEELLYEINKFSSIIVAGDYAEELTKKYQSENMLLAAPHLRLQLASSLCFAAFDKGFSSPDILNAEYLQITKAEKDLYVK